ncbi:ADP-glyceromanno-heptose 6-epimerase [Helicobacter enhydrae]|uniref:ADP-glyceromanno-heptose 6-epimerase n=1 Tax=Helicobacter enhydrae TaxID=222136 RepID=A0A1B1U4I6_9HELI|nr:ADP-glyceromanno-heptose 6-epimerase [Helicobacter enhydrae]ANV97659.1 ADP-glyceromanno-heptose 6-epimerase [Helicobacter enhydrae]
MVYIADTLENKKILITGGAGFIGSSLAFYFQKHHPKAQIVVLDKFRSDATFPSGNPTSLGHFKNLIGFGGRVVCADINDHRVMQCLFDEYRGFDYVFHQAAISDTTALNQEQVMQTNHDSFIVLLRLTLQFGGKMIYASSAGTYGNSPAPNQVGIGEEPENVYGFSKLCMDMSVRKILGDTPSSSVVGLRFFNVYGPREFYKGKTASMILQLGLQALTSKKVRLFKFGEQQRDFVYIDDVVQANVKAIEGESGIYNVGSGESRSFNDIVARLKRHLGEFEVEYIDNPYTFYQNNTLADIASTKERLGYCPRFSLEDGIDDYIDEIKTLATKAF